MYIEQYYINVKHFKTMCLCEVSSNIPTLQGLYRSHDASNIPTKWFTIMFSYNLLKFFKRLYLPVGPCISELIEPYQLGLAYKYYYDFFRILRTKHYASNHIRGCTIWNRWCLRFKSGTHSCVIEKISAINCRKQLLRRVRYRYLLGVSRSRQYLD